MKPRQSIAGHCKGILIMGALHAMGGFCAMDGRAHAAGTPNPEVPRQLQARADADAASEVAFKPLPMTVPAGFAVEVAAAPPLVGHAMMGCLDDRGRLFLAESAGFNMNIEQLEAARPNFIRMLKDTDGDGMWDKSTVFADKLQIPNGALWFDGALYVAEPPGIWRFTDIDGDGVADRREHIAGNVRSNGMSSTLHGPVLHPSGRLFWCSGQAGYNLDKDGPLPPGRLAPGTFWLKPDGTEHEVFAVGGTANPVEVTFNDVGEVFGTIAILKHSDGQRHDALMHWVSGGVYDHNPKDPVTLKRTGEELPPLSRVGQVAPAGLTRYRGAQFGAEFQGNLFWTQFNTHKIIRTQLTRQGATFSAKDADFLVSTDIDFHPTDVIEEADGSLLVIDTGGWFRHGCPTSQIAKPDVRGAIYRIRRTDGPRPGDPSGRKIDWAGASAAELGNLLGDPRPAVADQAMAALAGRAEAAEATLHNMLGQSSSVQARRNAVWTLARINRAALIRPALADTDAGVRQAAVNALGTLRDTGAVDAFCRIVVNDAEPSIRREAATALGRIGKAAAVPALLQALRAPADEFLTHSLIYALIQINQPEATIVGLEDETPAARRGVLLALSQMDNAALTREQLMPLLRSTDAQLLKAAFSVAARDGKWMDEIVRALTAQLGAAQTRSELIDAVLRDVMVASCGEESVQRFVAEAMTNERTSPATRSLLVDVMARSTLKQLPALWVDALGRELARTGSGIQLEVIAVLQQHRVNRHDGTLNQLARDANQPLPIRLAALNALAPRSGAPDADCFELLRSELRRASVPMARLAAARTLAALRLDGGQLEQLAASLVETDALVLPTLLRSFVRNTNVSVGLALVAGLQQSPAAAHLPADEVARLIQKYPAPVQAAAKPLLKKMGADPEQQQQKLAELGALLTGGDFSRGKALFFGSKAGCGICHRVHGQGGMVAPNLTTIAAIRTGADLLESIVYPSASIVQSYEPFIVETTDGQFFNGLIARQTPEAIWLRSTDLTEHHIATHRIKSLRESPISLMPQGLDAVLSRDELRDLLAYLQGLKPIKSFAPDHEQEVPSKP